MDSIDKGTITILSVFLGFILILVTIASLSSYHEKQLEVEANRPNCVCGCVTKWEKDNVKK